MGSALSCSNASALTLLRRGAARAMGAERKEGMASLLLRRYEMACGAKRKSVHRAYLLLYLTTRNGGSGIRRILVSAVVDDVPVSKTKKQKRKM
jgi:hypothetical protein